MSVGGDFDTFDDLPELACNPRFLNELLFAQLQRCVGIIVRGQASQTFPCNAYWGRAVQLSSHETLQLRAHPKGLFGAAANDCWPNVIILAARRRGPVGGDQTVFAVLWGESQSLCRVPADIVALQRATVKTVAARNLHIMLPSLFNHHHPHWDGKRVDTPWPLLDEQHFHAVCSSSFSIYKASVVPAGENRLINSSSGGISQFVIAGQLAGVEIEDKPHRRAEPIAYAQWQSVCAHYAIQLRG